MAFTDQLLVYENPEFKARVRMAVTIAGKDVMGETQGAMSDTEFNKRQALASGILNNVVSADWAFLVASNPVITLDSTDSDIQFTVNSLFSDVAGVSEND